MTFDRLVTQARRAVANHKRDTDCQAVSHDGKGHCQDLAEIRQVLSAAEILQANQKLVARLLKGESI